MCYVQGMEVIFRVGIAILLLNLDELRCLDMEETIQVALELFCILTLPSTICGIVTMAVIAVVSSAD